MNIERVYSKFTDRVNVLSSNQAAGVENIRQFVDTFNEATLSIVREVIPVLGSNQELREFMQVLLTPAELSGVVQGRHYSYPLPDNFEAWSDAYVEAVKGQCKLKLRVWKADPGEETRYYSDGMYCPSFEWEETFATLGSNKARVFVKDFELLKLYLTYYREPRLVDLEGYETENGPSTNIDPEFDGRFLEMILDRSAKLHLRNVGQIDKASLFA